jgi:uncharacterized protein YqhQ
MDFKKIFIKEACPTKIGGQAVMEGIMMRGEERSAIVIHLPDDSLYIKTEKLKERSKWAKVPILRGVVIFVDSLMTGFRSLTFSAEVLTRYEMGEDGKLTDTQAGEAQEPGAAEETAEAATDGGPAIGAEAMQAAEEKPEKKKGEAGMKVAMAFSVVIALAFTIGIFIIGPTWAMGFAGKWVKNEILLNLIEGVLRIVLFVLYVSLISLMKDIRTVFRYHGAEHKCIHCFENNLPLTPENCQQFETLHPRCGTSFLMFVMVISLLLFSLLGWPNLVIRIGSRLLLIPVIAGLSYELLRWAGRSDNLIVKILSVPGLLLQRLTTKEPRTEELVVAIASMKAVMVPEDTPEYEGFCDIEGKAV